MWIVAILVTVASGARGDGIDWRPASPAPIPAPPPAPVVVPAAAPPDTTHWTPAAPPTTPPPTTPPRPTPPPPAKTVVDAPEFHPTAAAPMPAPPPAPALPALPPVTVSAAALPPTADPSRQILPTHLPTLAIPAMPTAADNPAGQPSEPLPQPRPVPDPVPPAVPVVQPPSPWTVNPAAACVVPDTRPVLEPAPNLPGNTLNGVPVRGKTFGSPPLRLSRDFALRDVFGYDLARVESGPNLGELTGAGGPTPADFFVETEYLLWWANRPRIPVLATTSDGRGQGFLGQPGTTTLLGPGTFGPSLRDGFRVRAGGWLGDCSDHGFDASFFFLGRRGESRTFDGLPTITRPFFAPNLDAEFGEFGEIVALPDLSAGSLRVDTDSFLWGADVNYKHAVCRTCDRTTAWFAGYRHLNLRESLTITEKLRAIGPLATDPIGTEVVVQDRFRTHNRFHGGQVGWLTSRRMGRWELDLRASVALGVTVQTLDIDGFQQRTRPGQPTDSFNGGLLATGPNLGRFNSTRFSVVPEATATLGYAVTPNVRLTVGYNLLYWNNVIRPGDQIDRVVDVTLVPNPPAGVPASGQNRPLPLFRQSDFWVQGISFGAQLRW
jgi:hypothetical protein